MGATFVEDGCAVRRLIIRCTSMYSNNSLTDKPGPATVLPIQEAMNEQALHVSELRYRRLFEAARDGILILESDTGRISDVNPFLTVMLGFSHDELVGTPVWELGPVKDRASNKAKFLQLQRDGYIRYEDMP